MRWFVCTTILLAFAACARTDLRTSSGDAGAGGDPGGASGDVTGGDPFSGGDSGVDLDGEQIELFDGWTASVFWDFSAEYDYDAADFIDSPADNVEVLDNMPLLMAVLDEPFPEGLVVVAGRQLLIFVPPSTFMVRDYTPAAAETTGPDVISGIAQVPALSVLADQPYLLLASCSYDDGDGLYGVAPDWSLTRLRTTNNVRFTLFDPTGTFDAVGAPTLYWALDLGVYVYPTTDSTGTNILPSPARKHECVLSQSAQLVCSEWNLDGLDLAAIDSVNHLSTTLVDSTFWIGLATGDLSRLPGYVYAALDDQFAEIAADGTITPKARTRQPTEWYWVDAVVPPADHTLGTELAVYVLEFHAPSQDDIDRVRILRLAPP